MKASRFVCQYMYWCWSHMSITLWHGLCKGMDETLWCSYMYVLQRVPLIETALAVNNNCGRISAGRLVSNYYSLVYQR